MLAAVLDKATEGALNAPLLFGHTADQVTALGTAAVAGATILLVAVTAVLAIAACYQLPLLRKQLKALSDQLAETREADAAQATRHKEAIDAAERRLLETRTMDACHKVDTDPVLTACSKRIWEASDGGTNYKTGRVDEHDLILVLNYIDGLAIGILQEVYAAEIVKDHTGLMFRKAVECIFPSGVITPDGYEALIEVHKRFYPETAVATAYRRR
jgi:hypothetical protein